MEGNNKTWRDVCQITKEMSYPQREIISELIKVIKLILLIPAKIVKLWKIILFSTELLCVPTMCYGVSVTNN